MDIENCDNDDLEETQDCPFLNLPEEMFLHICSFLDITDIVQSLSRVCRKFYCILQSENMWKSWMAARWKAQYLFDEKNESLNWQEICYSLEKEKKTYGGSKSQEHHVVRNAHFSDVDAVLCLSPTRCITASRDRNIVVWNFDNDAPKFTVYRDVHEGWIWKLREFGGVLYSASWDNTINLWHLEHFTLPKSLRGDSPFLSLCVEDHALVYGGCVRRVHSFDSRTQSQPIYTLNVATSAILTLDIFEDNLICGSENKTLTLWDKRTRTLKQTLKMSNDTYPICSQMLGRLLYFGDKDGKIRVYSIRNGELTESAVVDVGHTRPVSSIRVTRGAIITASNMEAKVSLPLRPAYTVSTFSSTSGLVSGMDCCDGTLVVGTETAVEVYKSKWSQ